MDKIKEHLDNSQDLIEAKLLCKNRCDWDFAPVRTEVINKSDDEQEQRVTEACLFCKGCSAARTLEFDAPETS